MNKKFSTLLCASLMLSAFSVQAQSAFDIENSPNGGDASPTEYLKSATPSEVFQIRYDNGTINDLTDDLVLIVDKVGGKYVYRAVSPDQIPNLKASLWCLQLTQENAGKEPIYDFINKETGLPLAFDKEGTAEVGQSFAGWAFSSTWAKGAGLSDRGAGKKGLSMYTYISTDEVLRIKKAADFAISGNIDTEKVYANQAEAERRTNTAADAISFKLYDAGSYVLSANELNAFLKENNYMLKFEPDDSYGENPFSNTQLYALPAVGDATTHNFLYIASKASKKNTDVETMEKGTFLKVDTLSNGVGIEFLKLGWTDLTAKDKNGNLVNNNVATISRIPEQHKFLFTYKPTSDEIFIQVASALHRDDTAEKKGNYWNSETNTQEARFRNDYPQSTDPNRQYKYHVLNCPIPMKEWAESTAVDEHEADMLFIKLNNFTKADRVVTVGFQSINTKISFNTKSCVAPNLTSIEENIYVIYNEKGQVLAAPIHLNDDNGDNKVHWVTLDAQDPNHMPAYQWIVTKVRNTDNTTKAEAIKTSPVVIRNREYPDLCTANVQFSEENGKIVASDVKINNNDITDFVINFNGKAEDIFVPVPLENKKDSKLGYRFLTEDSLKVNKYVFNYLNPFTPDYWIANGSDKDSVNYVKKTADRYKLESGVTSKYGYGWDKNNDSQEAKVMKRLNFVRLERTNYVIKSVDGKKSMVESYNEKYGMGVTNYDTYNEHKSIEPYMVDTFFFKENNHWEGKHFYAIVETSPKWDNDEYYYKNGLKVAANGTISAGAVPTGTKYVRPIIRSLAHTTYKVGTADDGMSAVLKVQNLEETRTSAFTVEPDQTPLYRRFNNALLGENAGENMDATDTLFFREKIRGEYLMDEWNTKLQDSNVDYAGIWSENEAAAMNPASKGKYAFIVDTAWVRRGAGFVKPQYLISVDRHDQEAIETIPCSEADGTHFYIDEKGNAHSTDKWHCQHATKGRPGFHYGKYLISFGDSAIVNSLDKPYMDIKGGYTRVGFVEAIHYGDSLYILDEEFVKVAKDDPAKLSVEKIIAAYKKAGKNLIVNLKGDNHKNATWSFRYVDPMKAMQAYADGVEGVNNEFMFESNIYNETAAESQYISNDVSKEGKATHGFDHAVEGSIAPRYAAWLKMQNGCLVLTRGDSKFDDAKTGSDGALIFNAYQAAEKDMVTSNDEVAVEGVSVVAGNGTVTVQGAAGKSVVITNILGKVVAETVLTSDNATIAVPAGIVAVAIDGEEAVKAIVK